MSRFAAVLVALSACVLPRVAGASVTFTDGTFNLANYTTSPVVQTNLTGTASQCASCGVGGSQGLEVTLTPSPGTSTYGQPFANNGFTYNPQIQGAISSVAASIQKNVTTSFTTSALGNNFRVLAEQDGLSFVATVAGAALTQQANQPSGYVTLSGSFLASDFTQVDPSTAMIGTAHPNFAGDPLIFGFAQVSTFNLASGGRYTADYDNLSITVNNLVTTPEPGTFCLMAAALVLLAALRFQLGPHFCIPPQ